MAYMMFVDTSKCIGCKACQVACKAWHSLPTEATTFTGSYQNPPSLSANNLTIVQFGDTADPSGNPLFLFFKNQCRHCMRPKCQKSVGVVRDNATGIVRFTDACTPASVRMPKLPVGRTEPWTEQERIDYFKASCPFGIPQYDGTKFVKCDFCYDRVGLGQKPACASTCPVGAIQFGTVAEIKAISGASLGRVKARNANAMLYNGQTGNTAWVYLLVAPPHYYGLLEVSPIAWKTGTASLRKGGMCDPLINPDGWDKSTFCKKLYGI